MVPMKSNSQSSSKWRTQPTQAHRVLQVIENQKKRDARADDDSDTVLAYVALGEQPSVPR